MKACLNGSRHMRSSDMKVLHEAAELAPSLSVFGCVETGRAGFCIRRHCSSHYVT